MLDAVGVGSTTAAAVAAAISTWLARKSTTAALETVKEARQARRDEILPRLILEKDFFDFSFHWPHVEGLNGGAVFLARRHWGDTSTCRPTFSLSNFGQSPALELNIIFELDDPNGDFDLTDGFNQIGIGIGEDHSTAAIDLPTLSLMTEGRIEHTALQAMDDRHSELRPGANPLNRNARTSHGAAFRPRVTVLASVRNAQPAPRTHADSSNLCAYRGRGDCLHAVPISHIAILLWAGAADAGPWPY
jgi:hypothetical protein